MYLADHINERKIAELCSFIQIKIVLCKILTDVLAIVIDLFLSPFKDLYLLVGERQNLSTDMSITSEMKFSVYVRSHKVRDTC